MHKKKRGQLSVEYIIIVGFVMVVLGSAMVLFQEYAFSSGDQIAENKVEIVANTIVDNAREIYYLGQGSKKVVSVEMPAGVEGMMVVKEHIPEVTSPPGKKKPEYDNYFIVFNISTSSGTNKLFFKSDVPIITSNIITCAQVGIIGNTACTSFNENEYTPGIKQYKLESIPDPGSGKSIINVTMQTT